MANDRPTADVALQQLFRPIAGGLEQVEQNLRREMRSEFPFVDQLVRYGCLLGGKRLRPALLLLVAQSVGRVSHEHLVLATVVEMIHTATLIHDDVLDDAELRRHVATVNARWDNESSLLLGDFLFTRAFHLASTLDTAEACRLIGRATNIVCEGEIRQKGCRGDLTISEQHYLQILEAKTAELCACCCQLGARFAGGSERRIQQMTRYGRYLGIAFQIADDLLDVLGDEALAGKSLGTDLQKQKPTLPLIHASRVAGESDHRRIVEAIEGPSERRLEELLPLFQKLGSLAYARDLAGQFSEMARAELEELDESPAADALRQMTEFVVRRVK